METDDNYIPKLCQLKFNLMSSVNTKELPGFKELKNKTVDIVLDLQKHLKAQVIKHTKLEIKAKQEHLKNTSLLHYGPSFKRSSERTTLPLGSTRQSTSYPTTSARIFSNALAC
mmetsp:Transcript_34382/g.50347  ORF Transcript_34382/g.50347 Transcript_34382/m.50347 type:complete len:114 (+) Transcript_34382:705-1046(+)